MSPSEIVEIILLNFVWIVMLPFEINCNKVDDPLTSHLAPSSVQNLHLTCDVVIPHLEIDFCDLSSVRTSQGTFLRFYECLIIDFPSIVCLLFTLKD